MNCSTTLAANRSQTICSTGSTRARAERGSLPRRFCARAGAGLLAALVLGTSSYANAAPKSEPWPRWQAQDAASTIVVDHSAWDGLLQKWLRPGADGVHRMAYGQVLPADRGALKRYLKTLQAVAVSRLHRKEQRAYWINLYNAATVDVVLDHYPVDSILKINISPGLLARGPWGRESLKVEGVALSLDAIEHRILRPIWNDPRTHYAVNCASIGCPNLATRAYTAANMEALLEQGARAYVNHPRGAAVDNGKLIVASIYEWFKDDFGGNDAGVIAHLKRYAAPELARALNGITAIADDRYDWALNDLR